MKEFNKIKTATMYGIMNTPKHQKKVIDRLSRKIQKLNKKLNDIHLSIHEVCINCPMREKCLENECRAFQIEQIIVGDLHV